MGISDDVIGGSVPYIIWNYSEVELYTDAAKIKRNLPISSTVHDFSPSNKDFR